MKCTECEREIKPIVAIDIDGTIGRYHEQFLHFLEMYLDRALPRGWEGDGDWETFLGVPRNRYEEAKLAFRQGGYKRWMPAYHGASDLVEAVRAVGAEVWMTTTRPYLRLDSVDPDTREWLDRNGIYYDHLLYDENKYQQLLTLVGPGRVVAVIEDLPEQYHSAVTVFGQQAAILVNRPHNKAYRDRPTFADPQFAESLAKALGMALRSIDAWYGWHRNA